MLLHFAPKRKPFLRAGPDKPEFPEFPDCPEIPDIPEAARPMGGGGQGPPREALCQHGEVRSDSEGAMSTRPRLKKKPRAGHGAGDLPGL